MKKYLFLSIISISLLCALNVYANNALIYTSPSIITQDMGKSTRISVIAKSQGGEKICVVKGSIDLQGLTCQSVTIGSGVSYLVKPTCDNLNFVLGIQKCTTSSKGIFYIMVEMSGAEDGTATFSGLDVVSVGQSINFSSAGSTFISKALKSLEDLLSKLNNVASGSHTEEILEENIKQGLESVNNVKQVLDWLEDAKPGSKTSEILKEKLEELLHPIKDVKEIVDYLKEIDPASDAKTILEDKLESITNTIDDAKTLIGLISALNPESEARKILETKLKSLTGSIDDATEILDWLEDLDPTSEIGKFLKEKYNQLVDSGTAVIEPIQDAREDVEDIIEGGKEIVDNVTGVVDIVKDVIDFIKNIFNLF